MYSKIIFGKFANDTNLNFILQYEFEDEVIKEIWIIGKLQYHRKKYAPTIKTKNKHYWFFQGIMYEKEEFHIEKRIKDKLHSCCYETKKFKDESLYYITAPAIIHENGTKEWWTHGNRDRKDDLPAIEYANGDKEWWVEGERHRDNGPAVIYGEKQYFFKKGNFFENKI